MSDNPLIWNVGEQIPIRLFIIDPNTGFGSTNQDGYIILTIQRSSDNLYWNTNNWVPTLATLSMYEVDAINNPGLYAFDLPDVANYQADRYTAHASINNPPNIQGESYELHVSRSTNVRVYESEPI